MLQRADTDQTLHVLVATPSGVTGQGGIDRIMGTLKSELEQHDNPDIAARFLASRGSGHVALSPFYMIGFCLRMLAARLAGRVDLVHINVSGDGSTYRKLVIANCARLLGIPYVLHLHGAQYDEFWRTRRPILDRWIRHMFERAAQVVVLGRVWRDFVSARAPGATIVIVPNATAAPTLPHLGGGKSVHILFLGRIGERKGVPQLTSALKNIEHLPGWRATLAGDGDVEATRQKVSELGLQDRIAVPGWVGPDEVTALLVEADILVLPSFAENLPVSVIEGMAFGLAVITTPVGAVEDIITDGKTGLLVPPGDVEALTQALTRAVEDPALREQLGQAAMEVHRERLNVVAFANAICEVWRLAARRRSK